MAFPTQGQKPYDALLEAEIVRLDSLNAPKIDTAGRGLARTVNRSDYATLALAIAALDPYEMGTVHYDDGIYDDGDGLTISRNRLTLDGDNVFIRKAGNGPMFTITGSNFRINPGIALQGRSATYTGTGLVFTGNGTTSDPRIYCDITDMQEQCIDIGIGAAQRGRFGPGLMSTSNITASDANITSGDTTLTATISGGFQSPRDVGKYVLVRGALSTAEPTHYLASKIVSVTNSTTVEIEDTAGRTAVNEALEMHHPVFRFDAEYNASVNGDRFISGVVTGGYLLADIGGVQNLNLSDTNSRGIIFSDPLCAKVAICGPNRLATSGAPVILRGTSHSLVGSTCAGEIILAADSDNCVVDANTATAVIDLGTSNAVGAYTAGPWIDVGSGGGAPAFQNSWVNYGAPYHDAAYRLNGDRVELRGAIKSGTGVIFALPAAFVPAADAGFLCASNNGYDIAYVEVTAASTVAVIGYNAGGNNSFVSLDGISFSLAA